MEKPNILFILSDDQGAWAMGCAGNKEIITPNLDRIAEEGMRFDNFFCACPVCSPARASIITGTMPSTHGVLDWLSGGNLDESKFPQLKCRGIESNDISIDYLNGQPSYVEQLAQNGYRCAHSGKWHLGASDVPKIGFSKWSALDGGGCPYYKPNIYEDGDMICYDEYVTDVITDKAIEYLQEMEKETAPFYLSVHYTAPHSPWSPENHPEEYLELYKNCPFESVPDLPIHQKQRNNHIVADTKEKRRTALTGYYASITAMDHNIGKLLRVLDETGKSENTIVIFTSDNGNNMGHHGIWGKGNGTYPQNMYDTSVKVPFLIKAPGMISRGTVNDNLHSHCDIFESILDFCGISYEKMENQPGTSFSTEVQGISVKKENEEILVCSEYSAVRMLRTRKRKLILDYGSGENYFYDLEKDKNEDVNKYYLPEYQAEIECMKKRLEELFSKYTTEINDGRRYRIIGTGQADYCNSKGAFKDNLEMYYKESYS